MAGAGYKLFNTGDVLTAAQVNTYLMEQTIMVFANAAARTTALSGVVAEGMMSYLKDTKNTEYYNGTSWVVLSTGGDITGVTAGTGISGGGTSGTVTITNSMATEIAAKGDLIAGTGSQTFDNLTVGANNTILMADSTTATGLKWSYPGLSLVKTQTFTSASTINVDNVFSSTFRNYRLVYDFTSSSNKRVDIRWRVGGVDNAGAGLYYTEDWVWYEASGSKSLSSSVNASYGTIAADIGVSYAIGSVDIYRPFLAVRTSLLGITAREVNVAAFAKFIEHNSATSYDGFSLLCSTGDITGQLSVYGYNA